MWFTQQVVALKLGVVTDCLPELVGKGFLGVVERPSIGIADRDDVSVGQRGDICIRQAIHLGNHRSADGDGSQVARALQRKHIFQCIRSQRE
ncbi:MAG: hypothetical protein EBY89_07870 [Actinobacteria bacterium]|nr:hypothetical protein [Actinomycetota bacterium]